MSFLLKKNYGLWVKIGITKVTEDDLNKLLTYFQLKKKN